VFSLFFSCCQKTVSREFAESFDLYFVKILDKECFDTMKVNVFIIDFFLIIDFFIID